MISKRLFITKNENKQYEKQIRTHRFTWKTFDRKNHG